MVGNRRRAGSVASNIALNVPVLHIDDIPSFETEQTTPRSKSFSLDIKTNSVSLDIKPDQGPREVLLDPLNLKERDSIWESIYTPYKADLDMTFEDFLKLNDDQLELDFLNQLDFIKKQNDAFIGDVNGIISNLNSFLLKNEEVTNETSEFKLKSNNLIEKLDDLHDIYDGLTDKLRIFESLDSIVTRLSKSNTTKSIVRTSFRDDILIKLDEAIEFVNDEKHKEYKEVDVFKYRFNQCLIRALSLIRNYVMKTIKNIENDTVMAIQELEDKSSAVLINAIVNTKFQDSMSIICSPFVELYKRSFRNDEVANLLEDVYNQYEKSRISLLENYIIRPHINSVKRDDPF